MTPPMPQSNTTSKSNPQPKPTNVHKRAHSDQPPTVIESSDSDAASEGDSKNSNPPKTKRRKKRNLKKNGTQVSKGSQNRSSGIEEVVDSSDHDGDGAKKGATGVNARYARKKREETAEEELSESISYRKVRFVLTFMLQLVFLGHGHRQFTHSMSLCL